MPAEVGDVIGGRYHLEGLLGEGGMGAVYKATDVTLDRQVAIKLMHAHFNATKDAAARFEREAKVSAALHHPNAVKIFDFGQDEGRLFLVMEMLRGQSLSEIVNPTDPPPPHQRTIHIMLQTAEVLMAAHELGLVHRDLKPDNIFLEVATDGTDRVVVVDFGLAFIAEREGAERMTQEGVIMGTPLYMSPEQCKSEGVGPPSDIYACGAMLYEMLAGVPPFEGPPMALLAKHLFQPVVPPSQKTDERYIPRALEDLTLAMLAKGAEDRPDAAAVAAACRQLQHTLGERERARGIDPLEGRAARMINTVKRPGPSAADGAKLGLAPTLQLSVSPVEAPVASDDGKVIAVVGPPLTGDIEMGLRANGYAPVSASADAIPPSAVAVFAPGADEQTLAALVGAGALVIADTDAAEMDRVSSLLALGVSEVVTKPLKIEQLAKKLKRVLRKAKRRARK